MYTIESKSLYFTIILDLDRGADRSGKKEGGGEVTRSQSLVPCTDRMGLHGYP